MKRTQAPTEVSVVRRVVVVKQKSGQCGQRSGLKNNAVDPLTHTQTHWPSTSQPGSARFARWERFPVRKSEACVQATGAQFGSRADDTGVARFGRTEPRRWGQTASACVAAEPSPGAGSAADR